MRYLGDRSGALVIFDNVEDPLSLRDASLPVVPVQLSCKLLFTTRRREAAFPMLPLEVLEEDDALSLLMSGSGMAGREEAGKEASARAICRTLGCLPLARAYLEVTAVAAAALAIVAATGCSNTIVNPDASTPIDYGVNSDASPSSNQYALDFTASSNGGVRLAGFINASFSIDLDQHLRKFSFSSLDNQAGPGFISTYDFTDCSTASAAGVEKTTKNLDPGDYSRVEYVEIEMIRDSQEDINKMGACFGSRGPGGVWNWNFDMTPWSYDAATERYHVKIPIHRGPIDALKIVFDGHSHHVPTITFDAHPEPAPGP